ncbi:MAG: response regulator [Bacteroidia bacterium]|nr:response regulator [Bacteroidia bacterium]
MQTVFIIDDDPIFQFLAAQGLNKFGIACEVRPFENGADAIRALSQADAEGSPWPMLMLLDLNMPVMNGWEFLEACAGLLGSRPIATQIYVVTSSISSEDRERAFQYPMVARFISKPIPIAEWNALQGLFSVSQP